MLPSPPLHETELRKEAAIVNYRGFHDTTDWLDNIDIDC